MTIHWGSLLSVLLVSFATTVTVVALVALAVLGMSARVGPTATPARPGPFSPTAGPGVAVACLAGAAAVVLLGLWVIVAR
jgi:hypothetical protein